MLSTIPCYNRGQTVAWPPAGMPNVPSDDQLERGDSANLDSPRVFPVPSIPRPTLADLKGEPPPCLLPQAHTP